MPLKVSLPNPEGANPSPDGAIPMVRLVLSDSKELLRPPRELPPGELNSEGSLPDIDRLLLSEKDGPEGRLLLIRPFPVVLPNRFAAGRLPPSPSS